MIMRILLVMILLLFACTQTNITDFQSCVDAGNPVMESFPRQCAADGSTYTELIGGDVDEHGCRGSAGYTWCENKQKCLRTFEEPCIIESENPCDENQDWCDLQQKCLDKGSSCIDPFSELCEKSGGRWNECSNKCALDNEGNPAAICPAICEQLCECGTIAGLPCPSGYTCKTAPYVSDATGYCIEIDKKTSDESRAITLARNHLLFTEDFKNNNGRALEMKEIVQARCPGCWNIKGNYISDSTDDTKTFVAQFEIVMSSWQVIQTNIDYENAQILAVDTCISSFGKVVELAGQSLCPDGLVYIGEVRGMDVPHVCCVTGTSFCGTSSKGSCVSNADCTTAGCSGQICQSKSEPAMASDCAYLECYNAAAYELDCICNNKECQWA